MPFASFSKRMRADCSKHEVLLIVARAYELGNLRLSAANTLEAYLARVPKDPEADARRLKITQLRHQDKQEAATEAKNAARDTPREPPPEDPVQAALPWVVAGAGVVLVATGVNLYFVGHSNVPAGCDAGVCAATAPPDAADKAGNARGLQIGGVITGGVGLVALAGGLVWGLTKTHDVPARDGITKSAPSPSPTP